MLFVIILSLFSAISCSDLWYKDCGSSSEYFKVEEIKVNPYPVMYPGKNNKLIKLSIEIFV